MSATGERQGYPPNWRALSLAARHRAGWRCECEGECGLHRGRRCVELGGQRARFARGKVVLTVAHLDHDPRNCARVNLRAMCQRCHLRLDREQHRASAARTRETRRSRGPARP